jgi:hypothetical protein
MKVFTRRRLLAASIVSGSALFLQPSLGLSTDGDWEWFKSTMISAFPELKSSKVLLMDYFQFLKTSDLQTKTAKAFDSDLRRRDRKTWERYIVAEFFVTSNYLDYRAGQAPYLQLRLA